MKKEWLISLSIIISAIIFGNYFYFANYQPASIKVVGFSTKTYQSDIVKWQINLSVSSDNTNLGKNYLKLRTDLQKITGYCQKLGIDLKELTVNPVNTMQRYDQFGNPSGYMITQNIFIVSKNLDIIEKAALNNEELIKEGVIIESSQLEYIFSKLPEIKKELIGDATKDAFARANEIAKANNGRIGKLISARTGVFQIKEPYSNEVSDYGIYSTRTKTKDISVTVSATFSLK